MSRGTALTHNAGLLTPPGGGEVTLQVWTDAGYCGEGTMTQDGALIAWGGRALLAFAQTAHLANTHARG